MDPVTLGLLIGGGSQLLSGFFGDRANSRNYDAQKQQQQMLMQLIQGQMQGGPNQYEQRLSQLLGMGGGGGAGTPPPFGTPTPPGLAGGMGPYGGQLANPWAPQSASNPRITQGGQPGQPWYLGGGMNIRYKNGGGSGGGGGAAGTQTPYAQNVMQAPFGGDQQQPPPEWLQAQSDAGFGPQGEAGRTPEYQQKMMEYYASQPPTDIGGMNIPGMRINPMQEMGGLTDPNTPGFGSTPYNPIFGRDYGEAQTNGLGYTPGKYTPERIDIGQLSRGQGAGSMQAQDALMQFLRRDPAQNLGVAGDTLSQLSTTGAPSNAEGLIGALEQLQGRTTDRNADLLRGRARGLGQFGGTAAANSEALFRSEQGAQNNAINAGVLNDARNQDANRRLSASGTLGGLLQGGYGQQLQGMGQLGNLGLAGGDQLLRALMANQGAGNEAGQFNVGNSNTAAQYGIQQMLNALGMGNSMAQGRQQGNAGLIGLLAGQPLPSSPTTGGGMLDAMGGIGMLPLLFESLRRKPA